jgi:hypothetical protein
MYTLDNFNLRHCIEAFCQRKLYIIFKLIPAMENKDVKIVTSPLFSTPGTTLDPCVDSEDKTIYITAKSQHFHDKSNYLNYFSTLSCFHIYIASPTAQVGARKS